MGAVDSREATVSTARNPYAFSLPASPHLAAAVEGRVCETDTMVESFHILAERFEVVLVEGVGGLLVPLNRSDLVVDVAQQLELPVLVVVANRLGAVNHTLLTVEALQHRDMDIVGLIFNDVPDQDPIVADDNPVVIQERTGIETLGRLPWSASMEVLASAFEATAARVVAKLT